jgi:putative methyltransferase (TIGR04325 family)
MSTLKNVLKSTEATIRRHALDPVVAALSRLKRWSPKQPEFLGAYPDFDTARANIPRRWKPTYNDPDVALFAFEWMCKMRVFDYPVLFWLDRLSKPGTRVVDAGGNLGVKHIAFSTYMDLGKLDWAVYELEETVRLGRKMQAEGRVPEAIRFFDRLDEVGQVDLFICSGLLQYLDTPFPEFVARLPNRPEHILLNKVATREGPMVVTLQRIGPGRVPYQIRQRETFEAELDQIGYDIVDQWEIPSLAHVIDTHPDLGSSASRGYLLRRRD